MIYGIAGDRFESKNKGDKKRHISSMKHCVFRLDMAKKRMSKSMLKPATAKLRAEMKKKKRNTRRRKQKKWAQTCHTYT